jgi:hypothetical protein
MAFGRLDHIYLPIQCGDRHFTEECGANLHSDDFKTRVECPVGTRGHRTSVKLILSFVDENQ